MMWKVIIIALCLGAVGGCQKDPVADLKAACETAVKALLRSPSTYTPIKIDAFALPNKDPEAYVSYDADNAFGTPVRDLAHCRFAQRDPPKLKEMIMSGRKVSAIELFAVNIQIDAAARETQ